VCLKHRSISFGFSSSSLLQRIAALAGLNEQCIAYAMMKNRFHLEQTSTSAAPRHDITGPTTPPDSHPLSEMRSVVNSMDSPAPLPTPLSPQQSPLIYPPIINPNSPRYDPTEPPFGGRGAYLSPSPQPRERQEKPQSRSIRLPPLRAIAPPPPLPSPSTPTPRISSGPRKGDHMYSHATISISPLTRE